MKKIRFALIGLVLGLNASQADAALWSFGGFQMSGGWMQGGFIVDDGPIREARLAGLSTYTVSSDEILYFNISNRRNGITLGLDDLLPEASVVLDITTFDFFSPHSFRPTPLNSLGIFAASGDYSVSFDQNYFYASGPKGGASRIFWNTARRDYDLSNLPIPASAPLLALALAGLAVMGRKRARAFAG